MGGFDGEQVDLDCSHAPWECESTWRTTEGTIAKNTGKERLELYLLFFLMFIFAAALTLTLLYHCYKLCDCLRYLRSQPMYRSRSLLPYSNYSHHPVVVRRASTSQQGISEPGNWSGTRSSCNCVNVNVAQLRLFPDSNVEQGQLPEYTEFDPGIIQEVQMSSDWDSPPTYAEAVRITKFEGN